MLKKNLILFILVFTVAPATASHIVSANIYWRHIAHNQYVFTLELIRDCTGIQAPTTTSINGPFGNISCSQVSNNTYVSTNFCTTLNASNCGNNTGVQIVNYESATISLNGFPPPTGWEFSWTSCCYPTLENASSSNFYAQAIMYPFNQNGQITTPKISTTASQNIPSFIFSPDGGKYSYNLQPMPDQNVDLIRAKLSTPLTQGGSPVSFYSGYSSTSPLPDASENQANGPFDLDSISGVASYENYNVSSGTYIYAVDHLYFKEGQLVARVKKNLAHVLENDTSGNSSPALSIEENGVTRSFNGNPVIYNLSPGDSVELEITATDSAQFIAAEAYGAILDTGRFANLSNYNHAEVQSLNPGGAFSATDSNKLKLSFVAGNNNFSYSPNPARVLISFTDTTCTGPKQIVLPVLFYISPSLSIGQSTGPLFLCSMEQDSLNASIFPQNSYWSPGHFVSDSNAASVSINAQAKGWLYLKNPNYPNSTDSIEINRYDTTGFYLTKTDTAVVLTNNYGLTGISWLYEGFPIYSPNNYFNYFADGNYSVSVAATNTCELKDAEAVDSLVYSYNNIPSAPISLRKGKLPWANGFAFAVNLPFHQKLKQISLLGVENEPGQSGSSNIYLSIFDENDQNVFNQSVNVMNPSGEPITVQPNITINGYKSYRLLVYSDSGLVFTSLKNVNLPLYGKANGDFVVTEMLQASSHNSSRTIPDTVMPAVALNFEYNVGLKEKATTILNFYPNPSAGQIKLSKPVAKTSAYEIVNLSGQKMASGVLSKGEYLINVDNLSTGTYIIKLGGSKALLQIK